MDELNARVPSENEICSIEFQIASTTIQQGRGSDARGGMGMGMRMHKVFELV
ncbi:hypothetical protein SESBI_51251 [Sesbania bispinosa]|nr:hypothetical protein SESBI_51251 [Sesbania bispinosa]